MIIRHLKIVLTHRTDLARNINCDARSLCQAHYRIEQRALIAAHCLLGSEQCAMDKPNTSTEAVEGTQSIQNTETEMGEERDQWPSRLSFVLAAMGGAVGVGNLLRYPSIAARHNGLQWFIPYTIALLIVGIPILALEISLGQSMRGGAVVAFGAIHRRLRALGFTSTYMSFTTATYYVIIMYVCSRSPFV